MAEALPLQPDPQANALAQALEEARAAAIKAAEEQAQNYALGQAAIQSEIDAAVAEIDRQIAQLQSMLFSTESADVGLAIDDLRALASQIRSGTMSLAALPAALARVEGALSDAHTGSSVVRGESYADASQSFYEARLNYSRQLVRETAIYAEIADRYAQYGFSETFLEDVAINSILARENFAQTSPENDIIATAAAIMTEEERRAAEQGVEEEMRRIQAFLDNPDIPQEQKNDILSMLEASDGFWTPEIIEHIDALEAGIAPSDVEIQETTAEIRQFSRDQWQSIYDVMSIEEQMSLNRLARAAGFERTVDYLQSMNYSLEAMSAEVARINAIPEAERTDHDNQMLLVAETVVTYDYERTSTAAAQYFLRDNQELYNQLLALTPEEREALRRQDSDVDRFLTFQEMPPEQQADYLVSEGVLTEQDRNSYITGQETIRTIAKTQGIEDGVAIQSSIIAKANYNAMAVAEGEEAPAFELRHEASRRALQETALGAVYTNPNYNSLYSQTASAITAKTPTEQITSMIGTLTAAATDAAGAVSDTLSSQSQETYREWLEMKYMEANWNRVAEQVQAERAAANLVDLSDLMTVPEMQTDVDPFSDVDMNNEVRRRLAAEIQKQYEDATSRQAEAAQQAADEERRNYANELMASGVDPALAELAAQHRTSIGSGGTAQAASGTTITITGGGVAAGPAGAPVSVTTPANDDTPPTSAITGGTDASPDEPTAPAPVVAAAPYAQQAVGPQ